MGVCDEGLNVRLWGHITMLDGKVHDEVLDVGGSCREGVSQICEDDIVVEVLKDQISPSYDL